MPQAKKKTIAKKPLKKQEDARRGPLQKNEDKLIKSPKGMHLVKGMKDMMPDDERYWRHIYRTAQSLMDASFFERIETPILEAASLFVKALGEESNIIQNEIFTFKTKDGEDLTLRPDATPSVMRAYLEHGMMNLPQPVKLWYWGPFFRFEKPQSGTYRQFRQFGVEVIGDNHPVIDAQLISIVARFFKKLNLPITIQVNSIGDKESRTQYGKALLDFLKPHKNVIDKELLERNKKTPLRLLDTKDEELRLILGNAPQIVDYLTPEAHQHFVKVLEHLDELDVPYVLNPLVVRGMDYYTNTTFEVIPAELGERKGEVLGGGGRYNGLVESLGLKEEIASCGFSIGIERVIRELKQRGVSVPKSVKAEIFLAQLGDRARKKAISLLRELQEDGFKVAESFSKEGLKGQMEIAQRLGVQYTLIIGQKEIIDDTILLRDMENGIQETIDSKKVITELRKKMRPDAGR